MLAAMQFDASLCRYARLEGKKLVGEPGNKKL